VKQNRLADCNRLVDGFCTEWIAALGIDH